MKKRINKQIIAIRNMRDQIRSVLQSQTVESISGNGSALVIPHTFRTSKTAIKDLKVAAIMDRFTLECFRPECQLLELTPDNWKKEMDDFQPDLMFIESAWNGKDFLWRGKVNHCTEEVYDLTSYCHERNIPVVFWNKEDPVHTNLFLTTAAQADAVFTTDIESVETYKTELKHDRVYHLHFGAQPAIHNPIEKFDRKDRFCFAGTYYHKYKARCRIFNAFADYFVASRGFDIYDRNFLNPKPQYEFPEQYKHCILGTLDPSEIDIAYKGYVYGVNMNTVTQSQSMFARRVFELMASNTIVIGNYSRGVKNYFGDLTFCTDDGDTLRAGLERYCSDADSADKYRLLALRKVLSQHLMEDRMDYIIQKVFGKSLKTSLPMVTVCACVADQMEADRILAMFRAQSYSTKKLLLVCDEEISVPEDVAVMKCTDFQLVSASSLVEESGYLAFFSSEDWYGENYLMDMALATRYGKFDAIGKAEYFTAVNGAPERVRNELAYHQVTDLVGRRCMVNAVLLAGLDGADLSPDRRWTGTGFMAVDVMNYCEAWKDARCEAVEDMVMLDQGISISTMEEAAKNIEIQNVSFHTVKVNPDAMAKMRIQRKEQVQLERQGDQILLISEVPEGEHQYLYVNNKYDIDLYLDNGKLAVLFRGEARMNLTAYCLFYDKDNKKIDGHSFRIGVRGDVVPPEGTAYMKIAYRVFGPGMAILKTAEFGTNVVHSVTGGCFLSRSNTLVLTSDYPSAEDQTEMRFMHERLLAQKEQGKLTDVMCLKPNTTGWLREYEGINVIEGPEDMLEAVLTTGTIDTVDVYFLNKKMWNVLKNHVSSIRLNIHIRDTEAENEVIDGAPETSEYMLFWQNIAAEAKVNTNIRFVFESQNLAEKVFAKWQTSLPGDRYSVFHD